MAKVKKKSLACLAQHSIGLYAGIATLATALIMGAVGLYAHHLQGEQVLARTWALLPKPPLPKLGQVPDVKALTPFPIPKNGGVHQEQPLDIMYKLRLEIETSRRARMLVGSHPSWSISHDLQAEIDNSDVNIGMFTIQSELLDCLDCIVSYSRRPILRSVGGLPGKRSNTPMLTFNQSALFKLGTKEQVLGAMLELLRENNKRLGDDWYDPSKEEDEVSSSIDQVEKERESFSAEACAAFFRIQFDLYWGECETYVSWGATAELPGETKDVCERVGSKEAFNQQMFFMLEEDEALLPECLLPWAQAAGHPNPGAYKYEQ